MRLSWPGNFCYERKGSRLDVYVSSDFVKHSHSQLSEAERVMHTLRGEAGFHRWLFPLMVFFAGITVLIICAWSTTQSDSPLPLDRALQTGVWAEESRCIECHTQAETFSETGHAKTLRRATDSESLKLLKQFANRTQGTAQDVEIAFQDDKILARHSKDGRQSEIELDWCFGSGRHARTWVGTFTDSWGATDLVEFRWTWYHALDGFDITPGKSPEVSAGYYGGLGELYDHPKTRRCFGCHSTHMTLEEGRLDEDTLHPGVTCQSCHGPRKAYRNAGRGAGTSLENHQPGGFGEPLRPMPPPGG